MAFQLTKEQRMVQKMAREFAAKNWRHWRPSGTGPMNILATV